MKAEKLTLALTLVVKNEADIIAANIEYNLSRGIDHIIITDNGSTDGTFEAIAPYTTAGRVELIHEPGPEFRQSEWVSRMADIAFHKFAADWVIHSDTDEFWWPQNESLKSILSTVPAGIGILQVARYDFLPPEDSSRAFYNTMTWRETASHNFYGRPLPPKIVHRGCPGVHVIPGNHGAVSARLGRARPEKRLAVFHFPVRSYAQYEAKAIKGGRAYQNTFGCKHCIFASMVLPLIRQYISKKLVRKVWPQYSSIGTFWFRLYKMYRQGRLRDYYNNMTVSGVSLENKISAGQVVEDTRLQAYMRGLKALKKD